MKWEVWLELFLNRHCTARGLASRHSRVGGGNRAART